MTLCDLSRGGATPGYDKYYGMFGGQCRDGLFSVVVADWELDFEILNVRVRILIMWLSQLQL